MWSLASSRDNSRVTGRDDRMQPAQTSPCVRGSVLIQKNRFSFAQMQIVSLSLGGRDRVVLTTQSCPTFTEHRITQTRAPHQVLPAGLDCLGRSWPHSPSDRWQGPPSKR